MKYCFNTRQFTETDIAPERIAIAGSDKDIDWKTLKFKAEQLGDVFREAGIPSGHPVIIYGHKEAFFPLAIMACIHAEIAYIPIDTIYPLERIKKIIDTTESQVVINCTGEELTFDIPVVITSDLETQVNTAADFQNSVYGDPSDPLQYIIFTSGSTGEPKGVCITQSCIRTFVNWLQADYPFSGNDVFMNQAPFSFDLSQYDLMNAFSFGGTLLLNWNELIKDQDAFIDRLVNYNCSVWTSTPSFGYLFLRNERFNAQGIPTMKTFLFIGEVLPNRTCGILRGLFPDAQLFNAYGPTEATVATTLIEITDDIIREHQMLPVGYPMAGSDLFIEKEQPEDKEGELVISGDHVSTGYFKNKELNAEKFFLHNGKRAFRTGDLAYFDDGLLFCIGRNDDQVKMNGFRIELNEISAVLTQHELISDAVTVALRRNNEVKKLISFVLVKDPADAPKIMEQVLPFIEAAIPYYMIPGDIVAVDAFPYSVSHKIDKNQLIADYLKTQLG